jgi:hypothetical protein
VDVWLDIQVISNVILICCAKKTGYWNCIICVAALAPGAIHALVDSFAVAPEYIGLYSLPSGEEAASLLVELTTLSDGSQVIATNSSIGEVGTPVVVATKADIAKCSGLAVCEPGVYVIGTGDTGVSKAKDCLQNLSTSSHL